MSTLYLFPTMLGESDPKLLLPSFNNELILSIKHFIVEDLRSARRFLKKVNREIDIDSITFYLLNEHTKVEEIETFITPLKEGKDVGILSEAGCPAVADPGSDVVAMAQKKGIKVVPLIGPSSILLSIMASGFNGQKFAFNGYLPIEAGERTKKLKTLERLAVTESQTQLFIETPYRNDKMLDSIIQSLNPNTKLCVATDITLDTEFIKTKTIAEWQKNRPQISKRPTIFLIGK